MTSDLLDAFVYKPKLYKALYGIYYATEGFATTGILTFLPFYLTDYLLFSEGFAAIMLAIAAIPGYVKIIYGIVSDAYPIGRFGHRRGYVLVSIPLVLVGWWLIPIATEAWSFTTIVFIATLGFYVGDVAVDAWAVDVTPEYDRGKIMGIGFGATGVASVLGVLVTTIVGPSYGYPLAFLILGTIGGLGGLIWFVFAREKPIEEDRLVRSPIGRLFGELRHSYIWIGFAGYVGAGFIMGCGTNFMVNFFADLGLSLMGLDSETTAGLIVLFWSLLYFVGGVIGGLVYDKFKNYKTGVYLLTPAYPVFLFMLGLNQSGNLTLALITIVLFGLASGLATAAIMGFAMHITPKEISGTVFAIFTSLVNVGQAGIAMVFMGFMVENYNYPLAFLIGALVSFPIIASARFINPPWKKEGEPVEEPPSPPSEARWSGDM
jgi:MFS family permease